MTIKELAALLGVSPATVSLALNGSPLVAAKTRARVAAAAAKHGYAPDNSARSLRTRRSRLIGCLTGSITSSFFNALLEGVQRECTANGYALVTCFAGNEPQPSRGELIKLMLERNVDGIVFLTPMPEEPGIAQLLTRYRKPVIFCSIYENDKYDCVLIDNEQAGFLAMQELLANGHRDVLCCTVDPRRFNGNMRALAATADCHGVPFADAAEIPQLLREHPECTAIAAYSDAMAIDIMRLLRQENLNVPSDISMIGFDDMPFAAWPEFQLSTVAQPQIELGAVTVRRLLAKIADPGQPVQKTYLPVEIINRASIKKQIER